MPSPNTYKRIAAELLEKQRQKQKKIAEEAAAAPDAKNVAEEELAQSQIAFEQNYFKSGMMNSNILPPPYISSTNNHGTRRTKSSVTETIV